MQEQFVEYRQKKKSKVKQIVEKYEKEVNIEKEKNQKLQEIIN